MGKIKIEFSSNDLRYILRILIINRESSFSIMAWEKPRIEFLIKEIVNQLAEFERQENKNS